MLQDELLHYGYFMVFGGSIIEGDATMLTAAYLAHGGYLNMPLVVTVATSATFLADQVYYSVAKWKGADWVASRVQAGGRFAKIRAAMAGNAALLLLASRFMPGFRTIVPALCGVAGMHPARFVAYNLTGAVLWAAVFGSVGYAGRQVLVRLVDDVRHHEWLIAILIAGVSLATWLVFTRAREWRDAIAILRLAFRF